MRSLSIILALGQIITLQAVAGIDVSAELRSAPAAKKRVRRPTQKAATKTKYLISSCTTPPINPSQACLCAIGTLGGI